MESMKFTTQVKYQVKKYVKTQVERNAFPYMWKNHVKKYVKLEKSCEKKWNIILAARSLIRWH